MIDGREAIEKSKTMKRTIFPTCSAFGIDRLVGSRSKENGLSRDGGIRWRKLGRTSRASGLRLPRRRHGHLRV